MRFIAMFITAVCVLLLIVIIIIIFIIANEPAERRCEAARRQHYRAV